MSEESFMTDELIVTTCIKGEISISIASSQNIFNGWTATRFIHIHNTHVMKMKKWLDAGRQQYYKNGIWDQGTCM